MAKYALLRDRVTQTLQEVRMHEAQPATEGELALVHTPGYIDAVLQGDLSAAQQREIGFPWSPAMAERARCSVGATLQACRAALAGHSVAANLAGGTHHAYPDKGSGFCVFNDVAVAARAMQAEWARQGSAFRQRPLQVAVIDLDVHQGNGTARVFRGDDSVFTLSVHGARNFPFRKEQSDCDIELPDGSSDAAYLEAVEQGLSTLADRFDPGLVLYLAGADPHEGDRLGRLKVSSDGLEARDRRVFDWAWQRRVPVVMTMAGGYGADITATIDVQLNSFRVALSHWQRWQQLRGGTHWQNATP